jgi:hypothetical protein
MPAWTETLFTALQPLTWLHDFFLLANKIGLFL